MKNWGYIFLFAASGCACFLAGRLTGPKGAVSDTCAVRTDTLTVYDTIRLVRPETRLVERVRTDTVEVVTVTRDTVEAELPIERKVYGKDSVYRAVVSGYRPSLDEIEVWPQKTTVTRTERREAPKLSFGLQAGAGFVEPMGKSPGFGLYLGFGLNYRF